MRTGLTCRNWGRRCVEQVKGLIDDSVMSSYKQRILLNIPGDRNTKRLSSSTEWLGRLSRYSHEKFKKFKIA